MAVKSRPIPPDQGQGHQPPARSPRRPQPYRWRGCLPGPILALLVELSIPVVSLLLIALSVLGTFYGARGLPVPLFAPARLWADLSGAWGLVALAGCGQLALAVAQWGGRQAARDDRRYWALYLASLGLSVWWNWRGYGPPLTAIGVPWLVALLLIVAGDVAPELALVRDPPRARDD